MFDWLSFLDSRGIPYQSGGVVSGGNVAVFCPACGNTGSGQGKMTISLNGKGWRCLGCHFKGKAPTKLVQGLLKCSWTTACEITGHAETLPTDFLGAVMGLLHEKPPAVSKRELTMPTSFRPFGAPRTAMRPYFSYLRSRGFNDRYITELTFKWDVRYCTTGPYRGRIIFPVFHEKRLVTWQARSISPSAALRYKTLSPEPEKAAAEGMEPAIGPVNHYLLWYDKLLDWDADTICVEEGPFDALRTNFIGQDEGVVATCLFTNDAGSKQIELLHGLLPRFRRRVLLLDAGTTLQSIKINNILAALDLDVVFLPRSIKDPGVLTRRQLVEVLRTGRKPLAL